MDVDDLTKDAEYFKDGVEILGLSMNEMESFINPGAAAAQKNHNNYMQQQSPVSLISSNGVSLNVNPSNAGLVEKLEKIGDSTNRNNLETIAVNDIEEIGEHCVRLLSDIHQV